MIAVRRYMRGFTLIELMIVVVIASLLALLSYPSYREFAARAKRNEAKAALLQIATNQERAYLQNNTFTQNLQTLDFATTPVFTTASGSYDIQVPAADAANLPPQQLTGWAARKQPSAMCLRSMARVSERRGRTCGLLEPNAVIHVSLSFVFSRQEQGIDDQQCSADRNAGVCNVERRERPVAKPNLNKISNMTEQYPVDQVSDGTAEHEGKSGRKNGLRR